DVGDAAQQLEVAAVGGVAEPAREPVAGRRPVDRRDEVDAQHLTGLQQPLDERLVVEVVRRVGPDPVDRHMLCFNHAGSRHPRIASVIRTAATVARTSCTRTMRAPLTIDTTAAASEPSSRSYW